MAKVSAVHKDEKRRKMVKKYAKKRAALKAIIKDKNVGMEERFAAVLALSELPKNSTKIRQVNRCALTGRPHAVYRKFKLSRIAVRNLASRGELPGVVKSSW
jgi:small subunit ribosomal protein S14